MTTSKSAFQQNLVYPQTQDLEVLGVLNNRDQEVLRLLDQYQARNGRVCDPSNQYLLSKMKRTSYKESSMGKLVGLTSPTSVNKVLKRLESVVCLIHRKSLNIQKGGQPVTDRKIYLVQISDWIEQNRWLDDFDNCKKIQRKTGFINRNLNAEQQKYLKDQLQRAKGQEPDTSGNSNVTVDEVFEQNKKVDHLVKKLGECPSYEDKRLFVKDIIDQKLIISHLYCFNAGEIKTRLVKKVWSKLANVFLAIGAGRGNMPSLYELYLYRLWEDDDKIQQALQTLYDGMSKSGRHQVRNPWAYFLYHLQLSVGQAPKNVSVKDLMNKFKAIAVLPCNNRQECLKDRALKSTKAKVAKREKRNILEQKNKEGKILGLGINFWVKVLEDKTYGQMMQGYTDLVQIQDGQVSFYLNNEMMLSLLRGSYYERVLQALKDDFPQNNFTKIDFHYSYSPNTFLDRPTSLE